MESWGKLFTENVDYVNRAGGWWQSNKENIEGHRQIHKTLIEQGQEMNFELTVQKITFLKPDVALVHVLSNWPGSKQNGRNQEAPSPQGILTLVMLKIDTSWKIRALHNTLKQPNIKKGLIDSE